MQENNTPTGDNKNKKKFILGGVLVLGLGIGAAIYLSNMGKESTDNAQLDATIIPVRTTVQGFVSEVRFSDNQRVKRGDTLVLIDPVDYLAKLQQAEAALMGAQAQLNVARSGAGSADANATASEQNKNAATENIMVLQARMQRAEKDYGRITNMLREDAATRQQFDAAYAELESAKAQYQSAVQQAAASASQVKGAQSVARGQQAQIALAEAQVKQREAELSLARNQYNNTFIIAPFDGIISKKSVERGQYLAAGSPVCSAVDVEHLYVSANFKETQLKEMKPGQAVTIKIDAFPKSNLSGKLSSIGGATGAKFSLLPPDNATGNFVKITQRVPVRIDLTNVPQEVKDKLFPGLSVKVEVKTN
ncbi:MAG: HlyD family secretion protein [Chitinophagaceae bacterium]|nr:HlyD family secretion protein [Chitinophagaceae bacterium]